VPRFVQHALDAANDESIKWYKYHCVQCMAAKKKAKVVVQIKTA
jgi:hypothetical protein